MDQCWHAHGLQDAAEWVPYSGHEEWLLQGTYSAGIHLYFKNVQTHPLMPSKFQVTWIVNSEYDRTVVPGLYHTLLRSGHALGARRWLTSLQRRCQQLSLLRSDPARYAGRTR